VYVQHSICHQGPLDWLTKKLVTLLVSRTRHCIFNETSMFQLSLSECAITRRGYRKGAYWREGLGKGGLRMS
jgi:hypothetical protein